MARKVVVDCSTGGETWVDLTLEEEAQRAIDTEIGLANQAEMHRLQRNGLLSTSDWTQMPDCPLSEEAREAWRVYRQELRDMEFVPGVEPQFPSPPTSNGT